MKNTGGVRQPSNLLESVDVYQDGQRVDRIGLQPLGPNQSQKVTYGFNRSADAGNGTTHLRFTLDSNGSSGNDVDCGAGTETFRIDV